MQEVRTASVDVNLIELDLESELFPTVTKSYQSSFYQRVTFRMLDRDKRRRLSSCGVYFAVFVLGILIGLVPFLAYYVKDRQEDRQALKKLADENNPQPIYRFAMQSGNSEKSPINITTALKQLEVLKGIIHKLQIDKSLYALKKNDPCSSALIKRVAKTISFHKASIIGNGRVELTCNGQIRILKVKLDEVFAPKKTINSFDAFCKSTTKSVGKVNMCQISSKRVLRVTLGTKQFTELEYSCEHKV